LVGTIYTPNLENFGRDSPEHKTQYFKTSRRERRPPDAKCHWQWLLWQDIEEGKKAARREMPLAVASVASICPLSRRVQMARMCLYIRKKAILNLPLIIPLASTNCTGTSSPNLRAAERIRGLPGAHRVGVVVAHWSPVKCEANRWRQLCGQPRKQNLCPKTVATHAQRSQNPCPTNGRYTCARARKGACATTGDC
jgi:hypothetical protein